MKTFNQQVWEAKQLAEASLNPKWRLQVLYDKAQSTVEKTKVMKQYFDAGHQLLVNRRYQFIVKHEPVLQKLLKQGYVKQIRSIQSDRTRYTYLVKA